MCEADHAGQYKLDDVQSLNKHYDLMERLKAAADARDAEKMRLEQRFDIDAISERCDNLSNAYCDTMAVLMEMPAPDGEALLWKLNELLGEESRSGEDRSGSAWCGKWLDAAMSDARRLLSAGRA